MSSNNGRLYNLDHCTYICQYHLVWCVRYREKLLADNYIKLELKRIFKAIARWKSFDLIQWHIGDEHIHLYLIIPPKHSVAYAVQILKGKSSAWIKKKTKKLPKGSLWTRGYFVSTIGINEHQIRNYIKNQSHHRYQMNRLPI
jgi:putative transposase